MIKCEIEFDGNNMFCNGFEVCCVEPEWNDIGIRWMVIHFDDFQYFRTREEAIVYCAGGIK